MDDYEDSFLESRYEELSESCDDLQSSEDSQDDSDEDK